MVLSKPLSRSIWLAGWAPRSWPAWMEGEARSHRGQRLRL